MSYLNPTWCSRAAGALATLAVVALWLLGTGTSQAGGDPGSVTVTPASATVGVGGTTTVSVNVTAPSTGLSVWIVQVAYDPTIVQVDTNAGNPVCTSPSISGTNFAGYGCATKDVPPAGDKDTAVAFGAWVKNVSGTATGWTGTNTVATFTFRAVGTAGQSSPLTISVCSNCFLGPGAEESAPVVNSAPASISITAGTTRVWGDVDCGGAVSPVDSLKILKADAGQTVNQTVAGCPAMKSSVTVGALTIPWGDVDCGGAVSPVDSLKVLKSDAGQTVNQTVAGCPAMKSQATVSP